MTTNVQPDPRSQCPIHTGASPAPVEEVDFRTPEAGIEVPVYDADLYSDDFIRDPQPHYTTLRELGPVVYLPRHRCYAVTHYQTVREALRNWQLFSSASGVAGDETACRFTKGSTISSDPPLHDEIRKIMGPPLMPASLEKHRAAMEQAAARLVDSLLGREAFDGIKDFARVLPVSIVGELVGLPDEGRNSMLAWASASFDTLGVQNERGRLGLETVKAWREWVQAHSSLDQLKVGSWTARIREMERDGLIEPSRAVPLLSTYIVPSLDTTISATGELLYQLGRHPEQWQLLRQDASLVPHAVQEAVRMASPVRSFTRKVLQDTVLTDVPLPRGSRLMLLYASANRDERKYTNPHQFLITRRPADQLGFGHGIHTCAGIHLARMEMESLLKAMLPRVQAIHVGQPTLVVNNIINAFATLPARFEPALV